MPGVRSSIASASPAVPLNGHYPKLLQGQKSGTGRGDGSVWLVTAPKTGTIVYLSARPQKTKHKLGYYTTRLDETKMVPFTGPVTLQPTA